MEWAGGEIKQRKKQFDKMNKDIFYERYRKQEDELKAL